MNTGWRLCAVGVVGMAAATRGCASDPLIGTWQTTLQVVTAQLTTISVIVDVTFNSDGTAVAQETVTNSTSATHDPGCTVTARVTGGTFAESHTTTTGGGSSMTLTVTPAAAYMGTQTRMGCTNASDDVTNAPLDNQGMANPAGPSTYTYVINGNTLTLTQPSTTGPGTITSNYTRQ